MITRLINVVESRHSNIHIHTPATVVVINNILFAGFWSHPRFTQSSKKFVKICVIFWISKRVKLGYLKKKFPTKCWLCYWRMWKMFDFRCTIFLFLEHYDSHTTYKAKKTFWLGLEMYVIIFHPCGSLYVCEATASKTETPVRRCEKLRLQ